MIDRLECISRRQILHATWSLVSALYHPSECQVLTLALDAQLCYWEVVDGKEIRQLVLGKHSTVTALDIAHDGEAFITATDSSLIKVLTCLILCCLNGGWFNAKHRYLPFIHHYFYYFSFGSTSKEAFLQSVEHTVVQFQRLHSVPAASILLRSPNMGR